MAISTSLAMRKIDVDKKLDRIESNITNIRSRTNLAISKDSIINDLDDVLERLKSQEQALFKILGYTGTIENNRKELENNIRILNKGVLSLSGIDLRNIFIIPFQDKNSRLYSGSENVINAQLSQKILDNASDQIISSPKSLNLLRDIWFNTLSEIAGSMKKTNVNKRHYRSTSGVNFSTNNLGKVILEVNFAELSKAQKDLLIDYAKKQGVKKANSANYQITTTDNKMMTVVDYNYITKGLTAAEAANLTSKQLSNINSKFKNEVLRVCPGANQTNLEKAIDIVIRRRSSNIQNIAENLMVNYQKVGESTAIFVGKSDTQITGLLGEIQALYYIITLSDGNPSVKSIEWTAQKLYNGKQLHADILLNDVYGIQVKNSTADLQNEFSHFINFQQSLTLDDALNKLQYTDADVIEVLNELYSMLGFNIEYVRNKKTKKAQRGENMSFRPSRDRMKQLATLVDYLMAPLIYSIMYMDVENSIKTTEWDKLGNSIYLVGGVNIFLASQILEKTIKEIEQKISSLSISARTLKINDDGGQETGYTIVDAINDGKRAPKNNIKIKLKSAYLFSR